MPACLICGHETRPGKALGDHPVATHFHAPDAPAPPRHAIKLAVCPTCGTAQLSPPLGANVLRAPHGWLKNREPEDHIKDLVQVCLNLEGVTENSLFAGVSEKDTSTIHRVRAFGYPRGVVWDAQKDLGGDDTHCGVETTQALVRPDNTETILNRYGTADVIIARHILEHCESPADFVAGLSATLAEGGWVVIEVPDCERNMAHGDVAMVWEEHSLYFTQTTLLNALNIFPFAVDKVMRYPYAFEDVLIVIARKTNTLPALSVDVEDVAKEVARFEHFSKSYADTRARLDATLSTLKNQGEVALFGAGHLAASFVNYYAFWDHVDCIIDDMPEKQGLVLPGTGLTVEPSSVLMERDIRTCLMALSPDSEPKVIERHAGFEARGGQFFSVLADSSRSLYKL